MAESAQDPLLQIRSSPPSPIVHAFSIVRACWDSYGPQTWLLLYYPLLYLVKVAKRLSVPGSGREDGVLSKLGFDTATTLYVAILSPPLYVLLLRYCFFTSDLWNGKNSKESSQDYSLDVPERLLQTNVENGLSINEVVARRKIYGLNQIGHSRSWSFILCHLSFGPANLLLEACTTGDLEVDLSLTWVDRCCVRNYGP